MIKELRVKAHAKINLFLEVTGRRSDGYHELETVMQTVSLCDNLRVTYNPEGDGVSLSSSKRNIPCDRTNIACKCADLFFAETHTRGGVTIHIDKHIPVAAGLGGGSADGAAVLRALNDLTGVRMSTDALCALGAKAGADIPFCIRGGCVLARGIGEIHRSLPTLKNVYAVIAIGGRGSSTPAAYKALDDISYAAQKSVAGMARALQSGDFPAVCREAYNAFEGVVFKDNQDAALLKEKIASLGASCALMSGSGASVFGLFDDAARERAACDALRQSGFFAADCRFV